MSTDRRIKGLKIRQKSLLASFGLIKAFVDTYDEQTGACEIPVRLESLDALWTDFKLVQSELESLDEATIEQQLKQRTDFETAYYRVKGFLLAKNKVPPSPRTNTSSSSSSQFPGSSSHVRLPDVKLPVFSGNLDDWLNFHDLFVSLVHSSHELSNIQKFYYLRSSLAGDALKLIQTVPLSANNYPVAWNLLVDHFQNTARLKQSYLDALFEFPSLKRESATDLHSLVEKFEANVKVLKQLGEKTEFWDIILIRMLSIRLDPTTRRDWEEYSSTKDAIAFQDLTSFIQRRVTVLQTIQGKPIEAPASTQQLRRPAQRLVVSNGASQINVGWKCIFCSDHHPLYMCSSFSKLDVEAKESEVRRHQLCRNCLRTGHHAQGCSSSSSCRKCRGRHHTQLCSGENSVAVNSRTTESFQLNAQIASTSGEQPKASASATIREPASYANTRQTQHNVLLATAVVKLVDDKGTAHLARALLDSGSECCFITESFSKLIKAQRKNITIPISGIGQSSSHARYKIVSTIRSRVCDYSTSAEFLVLPKVTIDLPTASFDTSSWQFPPGIHLADPSFHEAKHIDIVIGAEIFFELFKVPGRIPLGNSLPTLVNSVLGWIVSGKISYGTPTNPVISNVALVADRHRLTEHCSTIEEDATPSSFVEHATRNKHLRHMSNIEEQNIAPSSLKDAKGSDALMEADSWLLTVYSPSVEPSLIDLHVAYVTTQDMNTAKATFHLTRPRTFTLIHVAGQLNQPPHPYDIEHQFSTAFLRTYDEKSLPQLCTVVLCRRIWFSTGARNPVRFVRQSAQRIAYNDLIVHLRAVKFLHSPSRLIFHCEPFIKGTKKLCKLSCCKEYQQVATRNAVDHRVHSHLNQPKTSQFYVFLEVVIRLDQKNFIRVLGNQTLPQDGEEIRLTSIEHCLNFQATVALMENLPEIDSLIPDCFLIESKLKTDPDSTVTAMSSSNHLLCGKQLQGKVQLICVFLQANSNCSSPSKICRWSESSKCILKLLGSSRFGYRRCKLPPVIEFVQSDCLLLIPPTQSQQKETISRHHPTTNSSYQSQTTEILHQCREPKVLLNTKMPSDSVHQPMVVSPEHLKQTNTRSFMLKDKTEPSNLTILIQYYCYLFFITNFGINFILYCITGQNFRKAVIEMFHRNRRSKANQDHFSGGTQTEILRSSGSLLPLKRSNTATHRSAAGSWQEFSDYPSSICHP